ncbi:MAG TPA: hypothetical protein VLA93_10925 [Pyrinomonadaceae bacterium]|nr:hypothetical protein [Pyrinomonadaceae bacterium]
MKRCPTCQLLYGDERLKFCRYDGAPLAPEPPLPEEAPTIRFSPARVSKEFAWLEDDPNTDRNRLYRDTQRFDTL